MGGVMTPDLGDNYQNWTLNFFLLENVALQYATANFNMVSCFWFCNLSFELSILENTPPWLILSYRSPVTVELMLPFLKFSEHFDAIRLQQKSDFRFAQNHDLDVSTQPVLEVKLLLKTSDQQNLCFRDYSNHLEVACNAD